MNDTPNDQLIPAKEALRRCGYTHRNSLPALIERVGAPTVRNGRNYFHTSQIERYLNPTTPTVPTLTPSTTNLETLARDLWQAELARKEAPVDPLEPAKKIKLLAAIELANSMLIEKERADKGD